MAIVTIIIILITVGLFVAAIFTKGLTHDIFLEAGVLLISIKIILLSYRNNAIVKNIQKQLGDMNSLLLINKKTHNSSKSSDEEKWNEYLCYDCYGKVMVNILELDKKLFFEPREILNIVRKIFNLSSALKS